jgi:Double zinc ribbon
MICPRCGESLAADATVCPSCGLPIPSSSAQRCPVCGAGLAADATVCPHCGTSLPSANHAAPAAYEPPPADEQSGPPTTPYAKSPYLRPPIMRTVPLLTTNGRPLGQSSDETPTALGQPSGDAESASAADEAPWTGTPSLLTPAEPEDIPFTAATAASAAEPEQPDASPETSDAETPETPDIERPMIHAPKPPLPDYDTPDIERPAVHAPRPPLPDYDTPDVERPAIHPPPANGERASTASPAEVGAAAGTVSPNGVVTPVPDTTNPMPIPSGATASPRAPHGARAATDSAIARIFGVQPPPRKRIADNAIQGFWLRYLPPESAAVPWISIPIGALLALITGLLATIVGLIFWSRAIGYVLGLGGAVNTNTSLFGSVLSPNLLQLFLLEHGVPMSLALGSPGDTGSFSALVTAPLTGLSLIPACALIFAGYVAAASDFSHRLRFSVVRGALVGPVYAVLLLLVALFGSSAIHLAQNTTIQLHPSLGIAFLAGLIWGTVLGASGGLLALRRHHLFTTHRSPDLLAGAAWGALIALVSGLLLAAVALLAGMAAHAIGTVPTVAAGSSANGFVGALGAVLTTIALLIVVAPVAALWLFALGTGATIDSWITTSGANFSSATSSVGLLAAQHHPSSIAWWLLLLVPLASYIIGGRAAAHIARADSLLDGALVGWLMAVALTALMLLFTLLTRMLVSSEATFSGRTIITSLGIAPSVGAIGLLVLLVGSIVGALGGASAVLAPEPGPALFSLLLPLIAKLAPVLSLAQRPWDMLDAARNHHPARTPMRVLLYAAALSAVVLVALFVLAVLIGWIASHVAPVNAVRGFDGFFVGLAVGVPLLLLASAAILAIMKTLPPLLTAHAKPRAETPIIPRFPSAAHHHP